MSARPPTLSVMLSIAHTAQKREPLAYTRDIVLLYILRPSFSKGFPFAARKREMQIVNTDYPLLEFGQRHFSRKNITCSLSRGEFTFKVPPRGKKRHRARIFAGCKRIYILHQCTLGPYVRLAGRAEECY